MTTDTQFLVTLLLGVALVLTVWEWYRGHLVRSTLIWLVLAQFIGQLARLVWPAGRDIQRSATVAGVIITAVAIVVDVRLRRRVRGSSRPQDRASAL
jgi:hypothetical protein